MRHDDALLLKPNMTFRVIKTLFSNDFGKCFRYSVRLCNLGANR